MEKSADVNRPRLPSGRVIPIVVLVLLILILLVWLLTLFNQVRELEEAFEPEYFARDQVLVAGPRVTTLSTVTLEVEDTLGITLEEVLQQGAEIQDAIDSVAPQMARTNCGNPPLITLYRIIDNRSVEDRVTVEQVVNAFNISGSTLGVVSDPNYVIGRAPVDPQNLQRAEGDPDSGEGYAVSPPAGGSGEEEFYNQWAFHSMTTTLTNSVGIELFSSKATSTTIPPARTVPTAMGAGTLVAVFDTSPFDLQDVPLDSIDMVTVVNHQEVVGIPDTRDHGIFVASLVDAVAPAAEIRLYRVLNESNQGDLDTLLRALDKLIFDPERVPRNPDRPLEGVVINLSLGIHEDPKLELTDVITVPVPTLHQKLNYARCLGAVIVAASGNDSADSEPDSPVEAQVPASYDFVISVGASNFYGQRSCFSNAANVYAPGGDNDDDCMSIVSECGSAPYHAACMVGSAVFVSPVTHYAYWNGTSFAAPLVSGQAALLLSTGTPPDEVMEIITSTAKVQTTTVSSILGSDGAESIRIINIPASLNGTP